jgi:hypothetical protein
VASISVKILQTSYLEELGALEEAKTMMQAIVELLNDLNYMVYGLPLKHSVGKEMRRSVECGENDLCFFFQEGIREHRD